MKANAMVLFRLGALRGASAMRRMFPLLLGVLVGAAPPAQVALSGVVAGASGKFPVYVALWDEAGFTKHPVREIRLDPRPEFIFRFDVVPGRWALSAFEDRNGNGKLDMGPFGPREPAGFWRPFHGWRKPRFDDVADNVERDTTEIVIQLR